MVCFLSSARYANPLDATQEKKFRVLAASRPLFVIGFAQGLRPRRFFHHARFYLLPCLPLNFPRYVLIHSVGLLLVLWCVLRHHVRIVVTQSPYEGYAGAWAKKIAQLFGKRIALIVESHGDFETSLFLHRHIRTPRLYQGCMRRVARFALQHADVLRAVSQFTADQLRQWAPATPIHQFPAWTDIDAFRQARAMAVASPWVDILFAGVVTRLKGVHHLMNVFIRLASKFPATRLVIAGRMIDKVYAAELNACVRQANLQERVQFVGEVPQATLAVLMRQAKVFVLPSYTEGLGRVIVEAMTVGTPVLASAAGGVRELVKDDETGLLVAPGDEGALKERLCWLLQHPREAQALGQRAQAFAEQQFSTSGYVNGYQQLFSKAQSLLKGHEWSHAAPAF
jgi:glycosyltransferase involved in cell wall biosynthesis